MTQSSIVMLAGTSLSHMLAGRDWITVYHNLAIKYGCLELVHTGKTVS